MIQNITTIDTSTAKKILAELEQFAQIEPDDEPIFNDLAYELRTSILVGRREFEQYEALHAEAKSWADKPLSYFTYRGCANCEIEEDHHDDDCADPDFFEPLDTYYLITIPADSSTTERMLVIGVVFKVTTGGPSVRLTFKNGEIPMVEVGMGHRHYPLSFGSIEYTQRVIETATDYFFAAA